MKWLRNIGRHRAEKDLERREVEAKRAEGRLENYAFLAEVYVEGINRVEPPVSFLELYGLELRSEVEAQVRAIALEAYKVGLQIGRSQKT